MKVESSFLSGLRTFFAARRHRIKRRHRASRLTSHASRVTYHPFPSARQFVLERLEDRLLLSATPTELIGPDLAVIQESNLQAGASSASSTLDPTGSELANTDVPIEPLLSPVVSLAPPAGLVGWWTGDGSAEDLIGLNDGLAQNGATYATGRVGQAFSLDGINDRVRILFSGGFDFTPGGQFTLETWVSPTPRSQFQATVVKAPLSGVWDWGLYVDGANRFMTGLHNQTAATSTTVVQAGQWYHVAVTYDNGSWKLYVNGVLESQATGVFISQSNGLLSIGSKGEPLTDPYAGLIDEVSIYNRALSAAEIQSINAAGSVGKSRPLTVNENSPSPIILVANDPESNPVTFNISTPPANGTLGLITPLPLANIVSQWSAEGNATDSIGPTFENGMLLNGASISVFGKVGQAFNLDGTDDYVSVNDSAAVRPTNLTIEAWINLSTLTGSPDVIVAKPLGAGEDDSYAVWYDGGILNAIIQQDNTNFDSLSVPFAPAANEWHHVAYTFDDTLNVHALYIDGRLAGSAAATHSITYDTHPLTIGADLVANVPSYFFGGRLDEVSLYSRALSLIEIQTLYAAGNSTLLRTGSGVKGAAVTYTPGPNFNGSDAFSFTSTDGVFTSSSTSVVINSGQTFVVNLNLDQPDTNPGDGVAITVSGGTSLRAAIQEANALPGTDRIYFNFGVTGPVTISPQTPLPTITDPVIIDGYTQPGSSVNTATDNSNAVLNIVLDGSTTTNSGDGLVITAGGTSVRGLVIQRFGGAGIVLKGGSGNIIEGNFIGTDVTGMLDFGNAGSGISLIDGTSGNRIGGDTPAWRNVISGNNLDGINIAAPSQPILRVTDIITGSGDTFVPIPAKFVVFNNALYFAATGELWRYDGATVSQVADINTSGNSNPDYLTVYNNALYFAATGTGGTDRELWRYDGRTATRAFDINVGAGGSNLSGLTVFNGELFFAATGTGGAGNELWRYNSETGLARLVQDINSGASGSVPSGLTVFNGALYFNASTTSMGQELFRYNGITVSPAVDIIVGSTGSNPTGMTVFDGALYFNATGSATQGQELWRYDGTSATLVADINTVPNNGSNPEFLTVFNNELYFSAFGSAAEGIELWRYNGITASRVTDIFPGSTNSLPSDLTVFNGVLYFSATGGDGVGIELWRYDGASVSRAVDVFAGVGSSSPRGFTVFNNGLYFAGTGDGLGRELSRYVDSTSDNVVQGNLIGTDKIGIGSLGNSGDGVKIAGGRTNTVGGTTAGAGNVISSNLGDGVKITGGGVSVSRVADLNAGTTSSDPRDFIIFDGVLYLSAIGSDGAGRELWRYDGTTLSRVTNIHPTGNSNPSDLAIYNGLLYFAAEEPVFGRELYRTDGTAAGTVRITDLNVNAANADPQDLTVFQGVLYFAATASDGEGRQMWSYNGTSATRITDDNVVAGFGSPAEFTGNFAAGLYFVATSTSRGRELWRMRLDAFGGQIIEPVAEIVAGTQSSFPLELAMFNPSFVPAVTSEELFLSAIGSNGRELWRVANLSASPVGDINTTLPAATSDSSPTDFVEWGGSLYFAADDNAAFGREIWRIGRSFQGATGPFRATDIFLGSGDANPADLTVFNDKLYFQATAKDGAGEELWRFDGTTTTRITDINTTPFTGSSPNNLIVYNGSLYFRALGSDGAGTELWRYDERTAVAASGNTVQGNIIGLSFDGTLDRGNSGQGVRIEGAASTNIVGGTTPGGGNVISGNGSVGTTSNGVLITGDLTAQNIVQGNIIGTSSSGLSAIGNSGAGVVLAEGTRGNTIGAEGWGRNLISGNLNDGVRITGPAVPVGLATTINVDGEGFPTDLTLFNGAVYFAATGSDGTGKELWRYDGITSTRVADINAGIANSNPAELTVFNGALYFAATGSDGMGQELWRYNGNTTTRITDINTGGGSSTPTGLAIFNGALHFAATSSDGTGRELWRYDGNTAARVADINAGSNSSDPFDLTVLNGALYFAATGSDGAGRELWHYNGISVTRVTDVNASGNAFLFTANHFEVFNGALYFSATNGSTGTELWRYNGTTATLVADLFTGATGSGPTDLIVFNNLLYFSALGSDGAGRELWRSDGTPAGTMRAIDLNSGSAGSSPSNLTVFREGLYFAAVGRDGAGTELWRYDGTTATRVTDIVRGEDSSSPRDLIEFQGALHFVAGTTDGSGSEIWRYRLTSDNLVQSNFIGTNLVGSAALPNAGDGIEILASFMNRVGGTTEGQRNVISGNGQVGIRIGGTVDAPATRNIVQGNYIGLTGSGTASLGNGQQGILIGIPGTEVSFPAVSNIIGGAVNGAGNVVSGNGGTGIQIAGDKVKDNVVQGNLVGTNATGSAIISNNGDGIAITDGASANTIGGATAAERNMISGNQGDGIHVDGGDQTIRRIADINPGSGSSNPTDLMVYNGLLYFAAEEPAFGRELYRTDGTTTGTSRVGNNNSGAGNFSPGDLTEFQSTLYFAATGTSGGREIWSYNGSIFNQVTDIHTAGNADPEYLTVVGQFRYLYFAATSNNGTGRELWRIGLDPLGEPIVELASNINAGSANSNPKYILPFNPSFVPSPLSEQPFFAATGGLGEELWRLNGSTASQVGNINVSGDSSPTDLVVWGNSLYFVADDNAGFGREIWRTNASFSGPTTPIVVDINVGSGDANPSGLTLLNNVLYFAATGNDGVGTELWQYNGSLASRVSDISIGSDSSSPSNFAVYNDKLFFAAKGSDGAGRELWRYDPVSQTTSRVADINQGGGDSNPAQLFVYNGDLYFQASGSDGAGIELWRYREAGSNIVQGNYIGVDVTGTLDLGNAQHGVRVDGNALGTTIGGTVVGAANVISGNTMDGVHIEGAGTLRTLVQGNKIGTNAAGTVALGNSGNGIAVIGAAETMIGGTDVIQGQNIASNVISGNIGDGITLSGNANRSAIQGNFIGTNAAGTVALGNSGDGIDLSNAVLNQIGGTTAVERNVISGNLQNGILVAGAAATTYGNAILGNYIGTNVAGTVDLGNSLDGVSVTGGISTVIGGISEDPTIPEQKRNLISGNNGMGIRLSSNGTIVQNNYIGTDVTGSLPLANSGDGVRVIDGSQNSIGGGLSGAGNLIAFNGATGIVIVGNTAVDNLILGNAIHRNVSTATLGIDLGNDGVTLNDFGDGDGSPNNFQNFPMLTKAYVGGLAVQDGIIAPISAVLAGTLNSTPNAKFSVEFFAGPIIAPAERFLGSIWVTTDGAGNASFDVILPAAVALGERVTATATDINGNTSEFGVAIPVTNVGVGTVALTVTVNGTGVGTVTSLPLGISTPGDQTEIYPVGTKVRLTANWNAATDDFAGWSGNGISSTNPILDVTISSLAQTITATFVPDSSGEGPPPVVKFLESQSIWEGTATLSWLAPTATLFGYFVRVGTEPGVYGAPIFVPAGETSLTLTNLPDAKHYFTVTTLTSGVSPLSQSSEEGGTSIEPSVASGMADAYATLPGSTFATVRATGVLANDPNSIALKAYLVTTPGDSQGSLQGGLNLDGSFIFVPEDDFTGTSFTYRVSDDNGLTFSGPIPVTIALAQESGQSQVSGTDPFAGLSNWTFVDEIAQNAPSNWSDAQNPVMAQFSPIGVPGDTTILRKGSHLYLTDGLPQGRTDYRLTLTVRSDSNGALGVMFRYVDANNFYRFSMDQSSPTPDKMRLVKVVNGQVTQIIAADSDQYVSGQSYIMTIEVRDTTLNVQLRDSANSANIVFDSGSIIDNSPHRGSGLAFYSASNPGGFYNVLGLEGLTTLNQNLRALEVRTAGLGLGTVIGRLSSDPNTAPSLVLPGSPSATFNSGTQVWLTATAAPGSSFGGWSGASFETPDPTKPHIIRVTMDAAKTLTAQFNGAPPPAYMLDVNADGVATPQDAIVILRYLSLVTGPALTAGVVTGGQRTDPAAIKSYLDGARTTMLDVNQDGQATPQDAIVILRHLSLVSGPALTAGVITGGAQTDPAIIKNYLNRYTPGATFSSASSELSALSSELSDSSAGNAQLSLASAPSAASTEESAVSAPSGSAPSAQPAPLLSPEVADNTALASPLTVSLSPDSETSAIAATQLNHQPVTSPWVNQFVGTASMEEDEELVVAI
jgi:ELWxxDGT repeat protein